MRGGIAAADSGTMLAVTFASSVPNPCHSQSHQRGPSHPRTKAAHLASLVDLLDVVRGVVPVDALPARRLLVLGQHRVLGRVQERAEVGPRELDLDWSVPAAAVALGCAICDGRVSDEVERDSDEDGHCP